MYLFELLKIEKGTTCVIGSGGKTTMLKILGNELKKQGSVILCTTTKIYPFDDILTLISPTRDEIKAALYKHNIICIGIESSNGKLATPSIPIKELEKIADYIIVEADGSKQLPLKAHAEYEPVIPDCCKKIILVMGITGLNQPINKSVHHPEIYSKILNTDINDIVTPKMAADVINYEALHSCVFINQVENEEQQLAEQIAKYLNCPVFAGALREGIYKCLH